MYEYRAPLRHNQFLLEEVFKIDQMWARIPQFSEVTLDVGNAALQEAAKLFENTLAPINRDGDETGVKFKDGEVTTPKGFKEAYRQTVENGWVAITGNRKYGGLGMPNVIGGAVSEMMSGSNVSFSLYIGLTAGATLAIDSHASEEIKKTWLPPMYEGRWAGCMCLTEPHAGTDLGIIRTRAVPQKDGAYQLSGTKIFITAGEHDLSENIVYLVLAKLPDAPAGSKGISLFLVPKFNINSDGSIAERNGVRCASVEHKMGIHASATCVMEFENARAELIGEPHGGLMAMFTMMNHERLAVGLQGLGCAELAYQKALGYARDRIQGRNMSGPIAPDKEADPIICHPDVRRMLLTQKALIEGGRALAAYVGGKIDLAEYGAEAERSDAEVSVALTTPIAKAFLTDRGMECCVLAQQVFGGHGYIREWGVEQLVRDVRITQIYEGTNGIQALDLIGRKIARTGGAGIKPFLNEARQFIEEQKSEQAMEEFLTPLTKSLEQVEEATEWVIQSSAQNLDHLGAASVEYLDLVGYSMLTWMWARMAAAALPRLGDDGDGFYASKLTTARFYNQHILPRNNALISSIKAGADSLMDIPAEHF